MKTLSIVALIVTIGGAFFLPVFVGCNEQPKIETQIDSVEAIQASVDSVSVNEVMDSLKK